MQKEVIQATLASEFGVEVGVPRDDDDLHRAARRRPARPFEIIDTPPNPFLATVGLRVDPAPAGSGVRFRLEVELGSMPFAFLKAVEETVAATLRQGLHGWQVTDCVVTMTHSGYWPRQSHAHAHFDKSMSSTAGDFRNLTPLVLMDALKQAGTAVYEPVHRFHLEIPADALRAGAAGAGPAAGGAAVPRSCAARRACWTGEIPGGPGARAGAAAAGADPGRGRAGVPRSTTTSRSAGTSRPGRGPTTTRSTARSTCCGWRGGSPLADPGNRRGAARG